MIFAVEGFCDYPENVQCKLTTEQVESIQLPEPVFLYMTFDDAPASGGSNETMDALEEVDAKGTFFAYVKPWTDDEVSLKIRTWAPKLLQKEYHALAIDVKELTEILFT